MIRFPSFAWLAQLALAVFVAAALSACDTADYTVDWFDGDDEEEAAAEGEGEDGAASAEGGGAQQPVDRPFPNLSSVPERPGPPQIKLEAVSMKQGLTADKENARYTDQALRSQTANVRARPRTETAPKTAAETTQGPTAADLAARPSAPPPPPPGTPAARKPPAPAPSPPAAQPARQPEPARGQVAVRPSAPQAAATQPAPQAAATQPAPQADAPPRRRPQPVATEQKPAEEPKVAARPAPAPEPVVRDTAPKRARPAPPPVATRTPPPAPAPVPSQAGTTTLIATIYFAEGQTELTAADLAVLRQVLDIQRRGGGDLRVVGHSSMSSGIGDPTRRSLVNFKVSLDRATIVAESFRNLGLPRDSVAVEARGDSQPIYSEETAAGAAGNRRAEIFLDN